jgi:hypothetical protein
MVGFSMMHGAVSFCGEALFIASSLHHGAYGSITTTDTDLLS